MQLSDPQRFTLVSVIIVATVMIATGIAAPAFYRQAMTDRETEVMQEMISIITREEEAEGYLSASYLANYGESAASANLATSFRSLTRLPGFFRIKVFGPDRNIAWSDDAGLIGTAQTHNPQAVARALQEDLPSAFNPALPVPDFENLIEFYIPFHLGGSSAVAGVVSLYRSAGPIDAAIRQGVFLLLTLFGIGGLAMYGALYSLFLAVYRSRREISSQFATLSDTHARLIQTEKLSAMGQMVSEIAHQLNNPLVGVVNLAELAEREIGNPARVKELLGQVRSAGEHCREYVQRVLQLSQLTRSERRPADINRLARDTVAFFQRSLGSQLSVTIDAPAEPLISDVDENLVRNALFNLIHNASQADPNGAVSVSVAREVRDGRPGVSMAVSDRGAGFPPELTDKLFEPFFTTRNGGTGLGLSIAQHIAILHGGTISAENRREGGASFTMWIPTAEAAR
jgi:two-component system, NtrC family, sensor histidine kinase HydH